MSLLAAASAANGDEGESPAAPDNPPAASVPSLVPIIGVSDPRAHAKADGTITLGVTVRLGGVITAATQYSLDGKRVTYAAPVRRQVGKAVEPAIPRTEVAHLTVRPSARSRVATARHGRLSVKIMITLREPNGVSTGTGATVVVGKT